MASYVEQIQDLIKFHQKKVAELEIALGVLRELKEEQVPHRKIETMGQMEAGMITLRRVETAQSSFTKQVAPKPEKKKRVIDHATKARREAMRREIAAMVKEGPVTSSGLIKTFGLESASKARKQDIYQTLYDMRTAGTVVKEEGTLRYSLPPQPETSH